MVGFLFTPRPIGVYDSLTRRAAASRAQGAKKVTDTEDLTIRNKPTLFRVFMDMPCGAAMHRIVCDPEGRPVDYVTTEVNAMFTALLGTKADAVVGVPASEHLSRDELNHWLEVFSPVALRGESRFYTMYSSHRETTFNGTALCPKPGYFFVMFIAEGQPIPAIPLL